jgi:hypothetical protein
VAGGEEHLGVSSKPSIIRKGEEMRLEARSTLRKLSIIRYEGG